MVFMDTSRVCLSKKTTYIGLGVLIVVLYLAFNYWTLRSNQATNSRAAEPTGAPNPKVKLKSPGCYAETLQMCLYPTLLNKKNLTLSMSTAGNASILFDSVKDLANNDSKVGIAVYYNDGQIQKNGVIASLTGADIKKMTSFSFDFGPITNMPELKSIIDSKQTSFILFYVSKENDTNGTQKQGMTCESKNNPNVSNCVQLRPINQD